MSGNHLDMPVAVLPVSVRLANCLANEPGLVTLRDLLVRPSGTWRQVPGMGVTSLHELREVVSYFGHRLDAAEPRPTAPSLEQLRGRLLRPATERERQALEARAAGLTLQATGERLGCSRERVRQIEKKHARKLKRLEAFDAYMAEHP